jgi:hypothetical protein
MTGAGLRAALGTDGIPFLLGLLVLLLVAMLVAVIRLPPWAGPEPDEDDQPGRPAAPARPAPAAPARAPRAVRLPGEPAGAIFPPSPPADAAGQPDQTGYTPRHAPGLGPGQDPARPPKVTGSPPWGPAPRPPGLRSLDRRPAGGA